MARFDTAIAVGDLREIVAKAASLFERLDSDRFEPCPDVDETLLQERLDAWSRTVAEGDFEHFQRCLGWDGLDLSTARRAVSPVALRRDAALPGWARTLQAALDLAQPSTQPIPDESAHRFLSEQNPLPFEEILAPFVLIARRELRSRAPTACQKLTAGAHIALERALLIQLIDTAAQPLQLSFVSWKVGRQSSLDRLLAQSGQQPPGRGLYLQFVREMLHGALLPFCLEYAALARLLATLTELWIEAHAAFLQHLIEDWSAIEETLNNGAALREVVSLVPLLSDFHHGRRAVISLQIDRLRVVYKPRSLGIEQAYNELLFWLNEHGCPLDLKVLQVIDRGSHGWVEFVAPKPCGDTAQLERHYQRTGALLCLLYVLDAVDCHYENLIAHGEQPVLVDAETLLQHRPQSELSKRPKTAQHIGFNKMSHSVVRTAMLPAWHLEADGSAAFDFSGVGSHIEQSAPYRGLQWAHVNTDFMTLSERNLVFSLPVDHVPTLGGAATPLLNWIPAIVTGFNRTYDFLMDRRTALLAPVSPLRKLAGQRVRFLFRATNTYARIIGQLEQPEYLRDGVERGIGLEIIKRPAARHTEKPNIWPVWQLERQQMERLDIPHFTLCTDQDALQAVPDDPVRGLFEGPSFDAVLARIEGMGEAERAFQVKMIEGLLYLRTISSAHSAAPAGQPHSMIAPLAVAATNDTHFLDEAIAIARKLRELAVHGPDRTITWLAPQSTFQQDSFRFQPTRDTLYSGRLGIAIFLAGLAKITGDGEYRELCFWTLQGYRQQLSEGKIRWERHGPSSQLGLAEGLGGAVYALALIGQITGDEQILTDARTAARLVTPEAIARDSQLDVLGGTAGALLGLLALHRMVPDAAVLDSAIACGRHLLGQSVVAGPGRAWKTLVGRPLLGFSHGAGGIAYALMELARVTGGAEFLSAACEAIAYEQSLFVAEAGNWPDLRESVALLGPADATESPEPMCSWCHGAAGIGLARLGGLPVFDSKEARGDIEVALGTTQKWLAHGIADVDQLCCGKAGQIEFLISAGQRLRRPELLKEARGYAAHMRADATRKGGYATELALHSSIYVPGFFRGETGIGYTFLRLAHPDKLPSILLFE
jgi:type 2 lantibiotic biosynthesis protein LanM